MNKRRRWKAKAKRREDKLMVWALSICRLVEPTEEDMRWASAHLGTVLTAQGITGESVRQEMHEQEVRATARRILTERKALFEKLAAYDTGR